ncbi:MAG: SRPBCC family protein [Rhodospirillales bacterium]
MITVSRTLPINAGRPAGEPPLTRRQVWQGLVMKAENPVPFVESMDACRIVERTADGLVRDCDSRGETMRERITYTPMEKVEFVRLKSKAMGTILNEIVDDPRDGLSLRFTFSLEPEGIAPGSAEEKAFAQDIGKSYLNAVNTTIATLRRLVREGALAAE